MSYICSISGIRQFFSQIGVFGFEHFSITLLFNDSPSNNINKSKSQFALAVKTL